MTRLLLAVALLSALAVAAAGWVCWQTAKGVGE